MTNRNFSMQKYWEKIAQNWVPLMKFKGKTRKDWEKWYKQAYAKYVELLGYFPEPTKMEAVVESSVVDGDLIRERVVFNSEEFMSVP